VLEPRTSQLLDLLGSPDPGQRDDVAYAQLARRITAGEEDGRLRALGARVVELLGDPRIQARSFGALVLAEVVAQDGRTGELDASTRRGWVRALSDWYRGEDDLRGFDPRLGWLHAVAHGADAIAAFASNPGLGHDELAGLLLLARDRVLGSGAALFADREEDRVALAMALLLARPELSASERVEWLQPVHAALGSAPPGPAPVWISNTLHTLRALYVLVDRGARRPDEQEVSVAIPGRADVADAIAATLRLSFPLVG
jgi:hypothetical protein